MSENTKNLILLSHGRCGTNLLCRILSSYAHEISNNNEISKDFPEKNNRYFLDHNLRWKLHQHYPYPEKFSDFIELARNICDKRYMLFKVFPNHMNHKGWELIYQPNSLFIILSRNHLDSYLSLVQSELYECHINEDTTNYKIKFSSQTFDMIFKKRQEDYIFLNKVLNQDLSLKNKTIKINYKDLFIKNNQANTTKRLLDFLKINPNKKIKSLFPYARFKQNRNTNFNFVINKEEMIDYMHGDQERKKILENSIYYKKL